jgi:hypothetical protein
MRRREFIAALGATAWPVMAGASTRPRALGTALAMLWPAEAVNRVLLECRKSDTSQIESY